MKRAARAAGIVLACLVAVYAVELAAPAPVLIAVAVAGVGLVAAGLSVSPEWTVWAGAFLLGLVYVVKLAVRDGDVDPFAPAVAVALYLIVEARDVVSAGSGPLGARAWHSLTVGFASALVVAALLGAGTAVRTSGPVAIGVSAICGAALLLGFASFAETRSRTGDD